MVELICDVKSIEELIASGKPVIIDFFAEWCGPCKMIAPRIEKLSQAHPKVQFVKIDVDQIDASFVSAQGVSAMPTFKFFKDGKAQEEMTVVGANYAKVEEGVKALSA